MPSPKRWFAVSREINGDSEVWELEDRFGPHAFRLWLEILSRLDENDNRLRIDPAWIKVMARRVRMSPRGVVGSILWMIVKGGWLTVSKDYGLEYGEIEDIETQEGYAGILELFENECPMKVRGFSNARTIIDLLFMNDSSMKEESKKNHSTLILRAIKYAKYHKLKEPKHAPVAPLPTGPDPT